MPELIHLIYCSAASKPFSREDLAELLTKARRNNEQCGVTGMLLYTEGSFFQILEGEPETVDALFETIAEDERHTDLTRIIREPIVDRSFGDWTMGYADITSEELDSIVGANDFFTSGESFVRIGSGRAKKLLAAFKGGRWRASLSGDSFHDEGDEQIADGRSSNYSYAYQPIIHVPSRSIFTYEALIRGPGNESGATVLQHVNPSDKNTFEAESCVAALELAARLGLSTRLNLNFSPSTLRSSPTAIASLLDAARRCGIRPTQIVLEILESEIIHTYKDLREALHEYRESGLTFAIDDFGAGYAGLNLLAEFQPDFVKLDMHLVRGIESNGPRQAIIRGIAQTCLDLGIDIIAEGVETEGEYAWFRGEGVELFQGFLFAMPTFLQLPTSFYLPS